MAKFEIFIPISNQFHWELRPFFYFFDRCWAGGQPVTVLSSKDPGLKRVDYVPVRTGYRDNDWHFGLFSDGLIEFLKHDCTAPLVILMEADYWLAKPVNLETVDALVDYMLARPDVLRLHLSTNGNSYPATSPVETWRGLHIGGDPEERSRQFFPCSLLPALWNRELWLELLKPGWNPWETETVGHVVFLKELKLRSLTLLEAPITYYHAARTRLYKVEVSQLPEQDRKAVRSMVPGNMQIL